MTDRVWGWDDKPEILMLGDIDSSRHREWFEEYLTALADVFPEVEYYRDEGSWRNKSSLTKEESEEVELAAYNQQPNQCYYNAQTAIVPDLTYVEGYAVGEGTLPHAWVEINGKVAEITPTIERQSYDYYGVDFETDYVRSVMVERGKADPIVESVVKD